MILHMLMWYSDGIFTGNWDPVFFINFDGADVLVEMLRIVVVQKWELGNASLYKFHNCTLYMLFDMFWFVHMISVTLS